MRRFTDMSLPEIGKFHGGRDHSTVIHGVAKIWARAKADEGYRAELEALVAETSFVDALRSAA